MMNSRENTCHMLQMDKPMCIIKECTASLSRSCTHIAQTRSVMTLRIKGEDVRGGRPQAGHSVIEPRPTTQWRALRTRGGYLPVCSLRVMRAADREANYEKMQRQARPNRHAWQFWCASFMCLATLRLRNVVAQSTRSRSRGRMHDWCLLANHQMDKSVRSYVFGSLQVVQYGC